MLAKLSLIAAAVAAAYYCYERKEPSSWSVQEIIELAKMIGIVAGAIGLFIGLCIVYLAMSYKTMIKDNFFDLDTYLGQPTGGSFLARAKVVFLNYLNVGMSRKVSHVPVKLAQAESPFVKGLMVTSAVGTCDGTVPMPPPGKNGALIVGTIRMGFGHHRIAYAASSWGIA